MGGLNTRLWAGVHGNSAQTPRILSLVWDTKPTIWDSRGLLFEEIDECQIVCARSKFSPSEVRQYIIKFNITLSNHVGSVPWPLNTSIIFHRIPKQSKSTRLLSIHLGWHFGNLGGVILLALFHISHCSYHHYSQFFTSINFFLILSLFPWI